MPNWQFEEIIENMPKYLKNLKACELTKRSKVRKLCEEKCSSNKGIYVFYENDCPLYVGRSDDLINRIQIHGRDSSLKSQAAFASNIAKGKVMADYKRNSPGLCKSKRQWRHDLDWELAKENSEFREKFMAEFKKAKKRVHKMQFRVVEVKDSVSQAIFEIYAHMALETPYNNFDNH